MIGAIRERIADSPRPPLPPVELSPDELHHVLQVQRRREVVRYVDDVGETSISDLAESIASIETGDPIDALSSRDRKKVYVALYQVHIPKLVEEGIVANDRGTVTPTERTARIAEIVHQIQQATGGDGA